MKTYSIVGMNWQKAEEFVERLQVGTGAVLVREPNNPVDANAVAVWIEGRKVGYVPKKMNVALGQYIDQMGTDWTPPPADGIAQDEAVAPRKAIPAKFVRSPTSRYPQVEVSE